MLINYFDPGLGAMIVQALIAGIASILVFSKNINTKIKNILTSKKNKQNAQDSIIIEDDEERTQSNCK